MAFSSVALLSLVALLATYLVHSTIWLVLAWCVTRWRRIAPDACQRIWKAALLGGILTAAIQGIAPWPQFGWRFSVSEPSVVVADRVPREPSADAAIESPIATSGLRSDVTGEPLSFSPVTAPHDHSSQSAQESAAASWAKLWYIAGGFWLLGTVIMVLRLIWRMSALRCLARRGTVADPTTARLVRRIAAQMGLRHPIRVTMLPGNQGPMVCGLIRWRLLLPAHFIARLDRPQLEALLAHELAHLARGDVVWNLIAELTCSVFFLQPLNVLAKRRIRMDAELLADQLSVQTLHNEIVLARCLTTYAEWTVGRAGGGKLPMAAVGMAAHPSQFATRVMRLLHEDADCWSPAGRQIAAALVIVAVLITTVFAPWAEATPGPSLNTNRGEEQMSSHWTVTHMLGGLAFLVGVSGPPAGIVDDGASQAVAAEGLPEGAAGFNGQVRGLVVDKGGRQVALRVARVVRVWQEANRAERPEALVDSIIILAPARELEPDARPDATEIRDAFLNRLEEGAEITLNVRHVRERLFVITELSEEQRQAIRQRRDVPDRERESADRDNRVGVPDGMVGISGRIVGRLINRDPEKGELTVHVLKVDRVWRGNKAKNPASGEGRTIKIEGVTGKFLDTLLTMEEGDGVRIEVKHVQGENLVFLGEDLTKISLEEYERELNREREEARDKERAKQKEKQSEGDREPATEQDPDAPAGLAGFRGILTGTVVSKDVERGVLVFKMTGAPRTWKQNKAPNPELSVDKELTIEGIRDKFLDVLLVLEPGDRVEMGAFHLKGKSLSFPGELFRKVD